MDAANYLELLGQALLQRRPLVLLLGQDAWRIGNHPDQTIKDAFDWLGRSFRENYLPNLSQLLQDGTLPDGFYDWIAERYFRQVEPLWQEPIARLPFNAVFTSAIDPALIRAFRVGGRDVEAILSSLDTPVAPLQRRNLHVTYLFGRAGERNPNEAPPRSSGELRRRIAMHAAPLLSRLVETTTPLGLVLIDGLVCGRDWLNSDLLYGVLSTLSPRQVYWFGWNPDQLPPGDVALLQELSAPNGPIIFIRERLSESLRTLEAAHKIDLTTPIRGMAEGTVTIDNRIMEIDPSTRLKVSTSAIIIDDAWVAPLPPLGTDSEYEEFRRFHGHLEDARRLIDGVRRGFAIKRSFETDLDERVNRAISNAGRMQNPILLHGQSGVGKSLALARLAYRVRNEGKCAVLFTSRSTRIPAVEELDEFCLRAESAGAIATVVVCDSNLPAQRYGELSRGFASRGRRVVVIGSTYRIIDSAITEHSSDRSSHLLEVPAELDASEVEALEVLMEGKTGASLRVQSNTYLLPAIYRMLPDIRPRLAAGLAQEARVVEDDLRTRGRTIKVTPRPTGALGAAFVNAGVVNPEALLKQSIDTFLGNLTDAASKAIDYVMVPGKLGCPVPVNMLTRAIGGTDNLTDIASLFLGVDLFRWSANEDDDIFIHPRLRLEAELICNRRLGTSMAEAEIALLVLKHANLGLFGSCERRFVLDLVHKLGPDGPFGLRYASNYLNVARALTTLREKNGVRDPSLMLQEATLRRRVLRDSPDNVGINSAAVLEEARQIVDLALAEFSGRTGSGLRRACANLRVERAAIYGFRAIQTLKTGASAAEVWQFYQAARDSARNAMFAADSYHGLDVGVWVPNDLLRDGLWDDEKRAELIADIWDGLERIDSEQLDVDQRERFEQRRVKVSQTLKDNELERDALTALDLLGSCAGPLLQARVLGGALKGSGRAADADVSRAELVVGFMKPKIDRIREDARCLRYLIRALWTNATRSYLFGSERAPLPEKTEDLEELLGLLERLVELEGATGDSRTQYLRAVLLWRLQREHAARDVWNLLSHESAFNDPKRVVRHHLWTERGGEPRLFFGRVLSVDVSSDRMRVQVEDLRHEIELRQRDFPQVEPRRGATISGGFHIAFNFIGPVADPPHRVRGTR